MKTILKISFLIVMAALLLAAPPAQAQRLSLGDLLDRVEGLENAVDTLPPAMASVNAVPGVVSKQDVMDCVIDDVIQCRVRTTVLISIPPGSEATTEFENVGSGGDFVRLDLQNVAHFGPAGRKIVGQITVGSFEYYPVELLPEAPTFNADDDTTYAGDILMRAALVSDGLVLFTIDQADTVKQVLTESIGIITDALVLPYASDAQEAQIQVEIANMGSIKTTYIVTVRDCSGNIEPGVFLQMALLEAIPTFRHTLVFDLKTDAEFAAGNTCDVELRSPRGRLYHQASPVFPDPS